MHIPKIERMPFIMVANEPLRERGRAAVAAREEEGCKGGEGTGEAEEDDSGEGGAAAAGRRPRLGASSEISTGR